MFVIRRRSHGQNRTQRRAGGNVKCGGSAQQGWKPYLSLVSAANEPLALRCVRFDQAAPDEGMMGRRCLCAGLEGNPIERRSSRSGESPRAGGGRLGATKGGVRRAAAEPPDLWRDVVMKRAGLLTVLSVLRLWLDFYPVERPCGHRRDGLSVRVDQGEIWFDGCAVVVVLAEHAQGYFICGIGRLRAGLAFVLSL